MVVDISWKLSIHSFHCLGEEVESDNGEEGVIGLRAKEKGEVVVWETE